MNILDAVIIIFFIVGILAGFRRGVIKQTVLLVGIVIILVLSFYLRVPISTFLYKHLPFFSFGGLFKGVSVLNILLYELIAFLVVFSILYLILRVLLKLSGLLEKILKATIILGFFSKIAGGIVGFIESYIIIFVILFVFSQPFIKVTGIEDSKISNFILDKTPVMSSVVGDLKIVFEEIDDLSIKYKNDSKSFNEDTIKLFIKYDIVSEDNVKYLKDKGKI